MAGCTMKAGRNLPSDILLGLLLITGAYLWQRTAFPLWMIDLLPIQLAAYEWKHGEVEWMYTPAEKFDEWYSTCDSTAALIGGEGFGNPYFYPPFVAATLAPFSEYDAHIWRNVLFAVNVLLIFVNAWLILKVGRIPRTWRHYLWALALVLGTYPMSRTTKLGQIVPLLAVLTWMGLLWLRERKETAAGITLGFVSAVKLFPVGVIAFPLIARRLKTVVIGLGTIAAIYGLSLLTLGLHVHQLFWVAARQFGTLVYPYQGNQSLIGWFVRLFRDRPLIDIVPFTDPGIEIARYAIIIAVAGITLAWMWWHRRAIREDSFAAFAGLLMSGMILSLPTSWDHYWLWLLPVLGWALYEEWTAGDSRLRLIWILVSGFLFVTKLTRFYVETELGRLMTGSQTVGMLMLWMWLVWRVRRAAQVAAP
ncbi:MAG: glycosyltransferase family 87 protein [bacterium]|nr:glycosyltransferase family 87 protein [bacterium]